MLDDIPQDPVKKIDKLTPASLDIREKESPKVDSGVSSIEKSKAVKPEVIPPMNTPILTAPSNQECVAYAVASLDATGRPVTQTIHSFVLKGEEIKNSVVEGWLKNLREIEETVRRLLASPAYQQLQEIKRKGDPLSSSVSGVQGVASASAGAKKGDQVELLSALDRLQVLERVLPSAEVAEASSTLKDSSRVLVIPLTAALLAGMGVAGGAGALHSVNTVGGVMDLVSRLQPLFPTVGVQDLVPLINLMVVGPIYYNSWREAVSNLTSRERESHVSAIQNFAKDVIKIAADPLFVHSTLVQKMKGTDKLPPEEQERLARLLKVVLVGVALSLLYSVEVGKVQQGKFGGMEPEELRELLLGKWTDLSAPGKKLDVQEELKASLIKRAWEQLEPLKIEDRTVAVEMLLSYLSDKRDLGLMLDPANVFEDAIAASRFDHKDQLGIIKG
jgi:hypothetical protein